MRLGHRRTGFAAIVILLALSSGPHSAEPPRWDFSALLRRTCRFERLHEAPGHRVGMASSYDRTLANGDSGGFIREEDGRYLMADIEGPGAVVRIWSANPHGKIWIYLDDAAEPLIHTEFDRLFRGEFPPFVEPFVHTLSKDDVRCYHWSYVPIPFAKSCRIYRDQRSFFQATYVQFPVGTEVEPLSLPLSPRHRETLDRLAEQFGDMGEALPGVRGERRVLQARIPPGEARRLVVLRGPAVIRGLWLQWPEMDRQIGRMALLTMRWDSETTPSVRVPLSDLFGSGFKSLVLGTDEGGMGYCYFPMPFEKSAVLSIVNESPQPLRVHGEFVIERGVALPSPLRTFHASWRRDPETHPASTRAHERITNPVCDPAHNHLVAGLRGRGHYVGTLHHRYGGSEGDEYVLVDGEPPPGSSPGTGNEDYFDMAWGPNTMDGPLAGGISVLGVAECFRAHLTDAIAFDESLRFSFEVFCGNTARYDYDSTAFWYQEELHTPLPELLPAAARKFRTLGRPPDPEYVYEPDPKAEGWWLGTPHLPLEGEALEVLSARGPRAAPMNMLDEGPDWSGGSQLCQKAADAGASFTVKLPPVDSDGWHSLRIRWTTGPEYGRVRLRSNRPHELGAVECCAPERGAVVREVGAVQRRRGDDGQLTVEVVGKGPSASSAWAGIDWLAQQPTVQPVEEVEVAGPFEVRSGHVVAVENPVWRSCRKLPAPTPGQIAEAQRRRRALPPAEALAPASPGTGERKGYALRATVHAPAGGLHRLDWRSNVPPPDAITVNGERCALDPRRFCFPSLRGERPRRFYVPLSAGRNELVWQGVYGPRDWVAPLLMGTARPPEGIFEGEDLMVKRYEGGAPRLQRLRPGPGGWSGRGHLWFTPPGVGSFFEAVVPVRKPGGRVISAYLTHAYNYGIFQLSVDGEPLGEPYDGYHGLEPGDRTVLRSNEVVFGELSLSAGDHVVRFEVIGKNEKSRGHMVGVDVLMVKPLAAGR